MNAETGNLGMRLRIIIFENIFFEFSVRCSFEHGVVVNPGMGLPVLHDIAFLRRKVNFSCDSCAAYC
jgi:hypothetical protein